MGSDHRPVEMQVRILFPSPYFGYFNIIKLINYSIKFQKFIFEIDKPLVENLQEISNEKLIDLELTIHSYYSNPSLYSKNTFNLTSLNMNIEFEIENPLILEMPGQFLLSDIRIFFLISLFQDDNEIRICSSSFQPADCLLEKQNNREISFTRSTRFFGRAKVDYIISNVHTD